MLVARELPIIFCRRAYMVLWKPVGEGMLL